ncbi:hypothetical protein ACJX0J_039589, partial [Zea mays]
VQKEDVNGGADGGNHGLVVSHETHTASELQAFAPTELMDEHQGMAVDAVLEPMVDNFMVSGTPEMETRAARVERLAAIPETELPSGRKRRSCTTDEHSLARAEHLKTERNGAPFDPFTLRSLSWLHRFCAESSEIRLLIAGILVPLDKRLITKNKKLHKKPSSFNHFLSSEVVYFTLLPSKRLFNPSALQNQTNKLLDNFIRRLS